MRSLLEGSEIRQSHIGCQRVQDAYSLRCIPQVHGPVRDALAEARRVFEIELNSATDNPLVFGDEILSGGNFHGESLAFQLDFLAIALSALAGISERRIDRLVNPALNEELPPFLAGHAGLESGLMMAQVTAASLVAENRVLAHPASTGSITTSGNKEDFVSMGMTQRGETAAHRAQHAQCAGYRSAGRGARAGSAGAVEIEPRCWKRRGRAFAAYRRRSRATARFISTSPRSPG